MGADSSNGRVVRASASGAVDPGFNQNRVKPITLKLINKPTHLLVVSLGKALSGISLSWCGGRQMADNS